MPSARLTIIVRLGQASSLDRLVEFVEERRTLIGVDVSVWRFGFSHLSGSFLLWQGDSPPPPRSVFTFGLPNRE